MKASAPKKNVWILGLVLGTLGIVGHFVQIQFISEYQFWLLLAGFVLLALGTMFKGF